MRSATAIILAAGKGTRMRSDRAKVLHPLLGRPLAVYPIEAALAAGARDVVVVVGHQAQAVEEAVREQLAARSPQPSLRFVLQAEQRGTGHAVACALQEVPVGDYPVLILNGDLPLVRAESLLALQDAWQQSRARLAFGAFVADDPTGYGRVVVDERSGGALRIVEHRDASPQELALTLCNAGVYCVGADVLHATLPRLDARNAQNEVYLTDLVSALADPAQSDVRVVTLAQDEALGVNTPEELADIERRLHATRVAAR